MKADWNVERINNRLEIVASCSLHHRLTFSGRIDDARNLVFPHCGVTEQIPLNVWQQYRDEKMSELAASGEI